MTLNYGALPNLVPNLATDDVAQGLNEWRNIQRIVRTTFKALHDALQAQAETIRSLQEAVGSKAPASDTARRLDGVEAALRRKLDAGADDFVRRDELKACYDYHRGHIESLQKNFDSTASSLEKDLRGKVDFESLTAKLEGFATSVELSKALQSKAERAEVEGLLEGKCDKSTQEICDKELRSEIFDVRSDLNRAFQELATHKADAKDLQSLESAVTRAGSHSAASADSLGERLASLEAAMDSSSKELLSHGERAAALHKQVSELALKVLFPRRPGTRAVGSLLGAPAPWKEVCTCSERPWRKRWKVPSGQMFPPRGTARRSRPRATGGQLPLRRAPPSARGGPRPRSRPPSRRRSRRARRRRPTPGGRPMQRRSAGCCGRRPTSPRCGRLFPARQTPRPWSGCSSGLSAKSEAARTWLPPSTASGRICGPRPAPGSSEHSLTRKPTSTT
mmetsp:Transcript_24147/g.57521  ORF Transcript_24147/g.57521 Transcript_24147/m.57521 type:complete len:450 (-) Transcript_24147:1113-2462(-)